MASMRWLTCRRLVSPLSQILRRSVPAPARSVHRAPVRRSAEKNPLSRARVPEQHYITELDKADALMLRKSHETGFLSWFRNGLLSTGIGVIAFVQSDVGREAGYAFFILGGVCVSFGGASYVGSLLSLRRIMLLSLPAVLVHTGVVSSVALLWLCAVSLYIGRLEVEIIHDEDEDEHEHGRNEGGECDNCRARRERRGPEEKGQEK
ncbi:transmembrane protein 160 isoform X2 [Triplophysa dalaica]|uniref:transmembrane protein 160 isoform X2 n=1 Tax=Triplophysa dalaica TaxID=1582913 RepID=UPI0024DFEF85|nr:transmembrane protein 160 isoform X2 [Triplophysa dalaica]